jgi:hypothetical protein
MPDPAILTGPIPATPPNNSPFDQPINPEAQRAASSRVTSWRPRGSGIGSSNGRFQPRPLMAPALILESGTEAIRQPGCFALLRHVARRTGRAGGTAGAGMLAFPWPSRMAFTYPAAVLVHRAFHSASDPIHSSRPSVDRRRGEFRHAPLKRGKSVDFTRYWQRHLAG